MKFWNDMLTVLSWLVPFLAIVGAMAIYGNAGYGQQDIAMSISLGMAATGIITGVVLGAIAWHFDESDKARKRAIHLLEQIHKTTKDS